MAEKRLRIEHILEKNGITLYFESWIDDENYGQTGIIRKCVSVTGDYALLDMEEFYEKVKDIESKDTKTKEDIKNFRVRIGFWGVKLGDLKIKLPSGTTEFNLDDEGSEAIFDSIELIGCKNLKTVEIMVTKLGKLILEKENSVSDFTLISDNTPDVHK